jgi:hypothetical protein
MLGHAERDAARLSREGVGWASAIAALLRAGIASTRGQADVTLKRLAEAQQLFEESALAGQLASTCMVRGKLVGGDAGAELVGKARAHFDAEGVVSPERFTAFFAPGFAEG